MNIQEYSHKALRTLNYLGTYEALKEILEMKENV